MREPWNIKRDDFRSADSLTTFIIFCEDEVSEPTYFKYFETSLIKVNTIEKQRSKTDNVLKAITFCCKENLMDTKNGELFLVQKDLQVWCVYDRDIDEASTSIDLHNTSFNEALSMAEARGIKVAWSNDAFELWVLLHFEDVDIENSENKNRKKYYDRLTEIFKKLENPNEHLSKALSHSSFNYKKDLKQKNNFRDIVRSEIIRRTFTAIDRAEVLVKSHPNCSPHLKSPATMVHHLVLELLRLGKKEIPNS